MTRTTHRTGRGTCKGKWRMAPKEKKSQTKRRARATGREKEYRQSVGPREIEKRNQKETTVY